MNEDELRKMEDDFIRGVEEYQNLPKVMLLYITGEFKNPEYVIKNYNTDLNHAKTCDFQLMCKATFVVELRTGTVLKNRYG